MPHGPDERATAASTSPDALVSCVEAVARVGDRAAFEVLFRYFAPRLKTYFLHAGAAAGSEGDEMMQETMLLVWRKAALFDRTKAGVVTWVFTIARNVRADGRRRGRHSMLAAEGTADEMLDIADPSPGADQAAAAAQREAALGSAFRTLPPEQMQVLRLAYFDDRSHAEIARGLGIPLGTVKTRIRLALARLRTSLGFGDSDER